MKMKYEQNVLRTTNLMQSVSIPFNKIPKDAYKAWTSTEKIQIWNPITKVILPKQNNLNWLQISDKSVYNKSNPQHTGLQHESDIDIPQ